ncbi:hypothetical protein Bca52824_004492 [Brassica carinata]|uniref:Uncharacterized protein n=1 Tax=Brassica carinata TaxID=52824 RepID=A0A8X8BGT6_BRACI|nr:hypothetical protein Bca52824_004492 [Brassica carinata]
MNDSALILTLAQHSHFTLSFFFSPTGLREEHLTRLHIILDGRSRLEEPKLPQGYIGNALFHARPISLLGDLLREPFSKTVKRVHEEIKKMDKKYLRSAIDCLEKHPDLDQLVPGEGNPIFSCAANFCIVSLPKDTAYELDFGWGKPFFKRTSHLNEGKGFVAEGPNMNVAFVVNGGKELVMPRFDNVLNGCTAKRTITLAEQLVSKGMLISVRVMDMTVEDGKKADEMMLLGSGVLVKPVIQWDDDVIADGKEGHITNALLDLLLEDMSSGPPSVRVLVPY